MAAPVGLMNIEEEANLLNTIRVPKDLAQLTNRLPKSNYIEPKTDIPVSSKTEKTLKPTRYRTRDKNNPNQQIERVASEQPSYRTGPAKLPQIQSMKEIGSAQDKRAAVSTANSNHSAVVEIRDPHMKALLSEQSLEADLNPIRKPSRLQQMA